MKKYFLLVLILVILFAFKFVRNREVPAGVSKVAPVLSTAKYKDGVYDGSIEDAIYGDLQVQATVSGGKLADVTLLKYPNNSQTAQDINIKALIILKGEVLEKQDSDVDVVSGASDTAPAFERSLDSALKNASL